MVQFWHVNHLSDSHEICSRVLFYKKNLLTKCKFHEHQSRDSHTLPRGMNKFLPVLSIFSTILSKIGERKLQFNVLRFVKPGSVKNIFI